MSVRQTTNTQIHCDGIDCHACRSFGPEDNLITCRAILREEGWRCDESGDWCPRWRPRHMKSEKRHE